MHRQRDVARERVGVLARRSRARGRRRASSRCARRPGISAQAWARPSRSASRAPASARRRPRAARAVGAAAIARAAGQQPAGDRARASRGAARSAARAASPATAGGANAQRDERERAGGPARARPRRPRRAARRAGRPRSRRAARPRTPCAARRRARRSASPSSQGTSVTWPEEEIGSSSAGPCRSPSATAWRRGSGSSAAASAAGLRRLRYAPDAGTRCPSTIGTRDRVVDVVQVVLPVVPVVAGLLPAEDEHEDPGQRAEEGQHA